MPYTSIFLKRITGIEPALQAWEARVLPLNYIRIIQFYPYAINCQAKSAKFIQKCNLIKTKICLYGNNKVCKLQLRF